MIYITAAEKYPELKSTLATALQKNDPDEIAAALSAIDKRILQQNIPIKDKEMIAKAREQAATPESKTSRMLFAYCHNNSKS